MQGGRRRIAEIGIAAALTVCAGLLLVANAKKTRSRNVVDRAVLFVASPIERVVSWVVTGIGDIGNGYFWLRDVERENGELRADNARLRFELSEARRAAADTRALEEMLDFRARVPARTLGARLVSGALSPQFRLVRARLDRGDEDVRTGMPVVVGEGLVGRVESVYGDTCEILLVTDPRSSVDIVMPTSGGRGVVTGSGDASAYIAKIEQVDRGVAVAVGDPVVTSGLGGAFPAGVRLGTVKRIIADPSSLYQGVLVEPAVNFAAIDRMLILLTVPPAADSGPPPAEPSPSSSSPGVARRVKGI